MGKTSITTLEETVPSTGQTLGGGEIATCLPATRGNSGKVFTVSSVTDLKLYFGKSSGAEYEYISYLLGRGNVFRVVRAPVSGGLAASVLVPFAGSEVDGLTVTAKGVGTGGNTLKVVVKDLGGTGKENLFSLAVFDGTDPLESFGIVSLNPDSIYYFGRSVKSEIISLAIAGTYLDQVFWTTGVSEITKTLSGGTDGSVTASWKTALNLLQNREIGFATLFLPTRTPSEIATDAVELIEARQDFVVIHDAPASGSSWTKVVFAAGKEGLSSFVAGYCPRGAVSEFAGFVPASIGVVDLIAKMHAKKLWYKSPAGFEYGLISNFIDIEQEFTAKEVGDVQELGLNPLVLKTGTGVVIWNDVTEASSPLAIQNLATRLLVNYFKRTVYALSQRFMFADHNEFTWSQWKNSVEPIVRDIFNIGGINAYEVKCDRSTMTEDDIRKGIMRGVVKIWPIKHVREIVIKFTVDETGVTFE